MEQAKKSIGFLKTTAIGGLFFLLPLIVLGALMGQLIPIVSAIATALHDVLPLKTPGGIALLIAIAILIVVLLCFLAGVFARRSIGQRIGKWFEKNIGLMFPRYTIIKEQMRGSIGGQELKPDMQPVLVRLHDCHRVGFEIERPSDKLVTVYLPGAPDAWSGMVILVEPSQLQPLNSEFWDTVLVFGELGRGSTAILATRTES